MNPLYSAKPSKRFTAEDREMFLSGELELELESAIASGNYQFVVDSLGSAGFGLRQKSAKACLDLFLSKTKLRQAVLDSVGFQKGFQADYVRSLTSRFESPVTLKEFMDFEFLDLFPLQYEESPAVAVELEFASRSNVYQNLESPEKILKILINNLVYQNSVSRTSYVSVLECSITQQIQAPHNQKLYCDVDKIRRQFKKTKIFSPNNSLSSLKVDKQLLTEDVFKDVAFDSNKSYQNLLDHLGIKAQALLTAHAAKLATLALNPAALVARLPDYNLAHSSHKRANQRRLVDTTHIQKGFEAALECKGSKPHVQAAFDEAVRESWKEAGL